MAEHLNHLSCLIVEDLHGTFLAHIFKQLALHGRLSHFHVAQRCHLPIKQAKSGLAVLIQLRLVQHHTSPGGLSTYQANVEHAYNLVRIGKVAALAHAKCGPMAATVVEHVASNGAMSASELNEQINNLLPVVERVSTLKINRALQALASHAFIRKFRPSHSQIHQDAREDIEAEVQQRPGVDAKAKGKKAQDLQIALVKAELDQRFDAYLPPESFEDAAEQGVAMNGVKQSSPVDETYVSIDFDVGVRNFRLDYVCQSVQKALGHRAGRVAYAAVAQADQAAGALDPLADALRTPSIHALAFSQIRDSLRYAGPAPHENGVCHTNGYQADAHLTNGVDDANNHDVDKSELETTLSLIAEGPFPFISHDSDTSAWNLDTLALSRWIRDKEIDKIVLQRIGPVALRIKRMLTKKGKLEEKNIQDLGLLVAKELRQTLARLETQGLIELQEVPREPQRQPNRTMFLWFFDAERAKKVLLGDLYKIMAKLFEVLERERKALKGTFEKLSRAGVIGKPEEYLLGEERVVYMQWRRKETWLMAEIERLDDSVALLRDM